MSDSFQDSYNRDSYNESLNGDARNSANGYYDPPPPPAPPTHSTHGISSLVRKKLMGYVGFANLPNQVHRKSVRKGFQFTAMVVGTLLSQCAI